MRSKSIFLAAAAAMLAGAAAPNITPGARVISMDEARTITPAKGDVPAKTPGAAQERFFGTGWTRRTKSPRGKRVRHSVAQDRRLARKARNVKRSKR